MKKYEKINIEKQNNKNAKKNNTETIYQSNKTEQFNSFKYKHFNNYYYNIITEQIKKHGLNNYSKILNQDDKQKNSLIRNELLYKSANGRLFLSPNINNNNINRTTFSYYGNKKMFENEISGEKNDNFHKKIYNSSSDNRRFNKNDLSKKNYRNQKKNIYNNIQYINKGQNTIPNILTNQKDKNKNNINSRNEIYIHNDFMNKSNFGENNKFSKTSDSHYLYRCKMQQLPKDAVNGLLLFLKKNKKHLAKTSKYYNIYKNYKKLIDNYGLENESVSESKNIKKNNNNKKVKVGYFGRKPLDGVDIFDISSTYRNIYNNKSEKSRHELLLGEINKLKGYIERNKNEKMLFIKDFLNKHNINYNDNNQLIAFDNFVSNYNKKQIASILKPYLGIKEMILDMMKEGEKINLIKKYNEKKNSFSTNNIHNSNNKNVNDNYNNNNQDKSYETKLCKSPNMILNKKIESNSEKKNNCINQKLNIITIKTDSILNIKNNKNSKTKPFDLNETNSYLKNIERQKKIFYPNKVYTSNYNLIIEEIGGELKKLSENIKTQKKYKIHDSFNSKQRKKMPIKINNLNNFNFITQSSDRSIDDIFITSDKNLVENNKFNENTNNVNVNTNNELKEINKMKIVKKPNNDNTTLNLNLDSNVKKRNMNKRTTQIIIKKLNSRPKINVVEVEDVKKRLKLTEFIVFNNAKKKLMFEDLPNKSEFYEYVNNNKKDK